MKLINGFIGFLSLLAFTTRIIKKYLECDFDVRRNGIDFIISNEPICKL